MPSCAKCNKEKERADQILLAVMGFLIDPKADPEMAWLRNRAVAAAKNVKHRKPAREILETTRLRNVRMPDGLWLADQPTVIVDSREMENSLAWVIRGLWYHISTLLSPTEVERMVVNEVAHAQLYSGECFEPAMTRLWPDFNPNTTSPVGSTLRYRIPSEGSGPPEPFLLAFHGRFLFEVVIIGDFVPI